MYCRPELEDLALVGRASADPLGRFAQNADAGEATAEYGEQVIEAMIEPVGDVVDEVGVGPSDVPFLAFDDVEPAWVAVDAQRASWVSYGDEPTRARNGQGRPLHIPSGASCSKRH
jgi:creatinine amidohydrolase